MFIVLALNALQSYTLTKMTSYCEVVFVISHIL